MDSNHRSLRQQIYSLPPLAARELLQENGAGDGTRTRDLLITSQLLYQLSYTSQNKNSKNFYLLILSLWWEQQGSNL